MTRDQFFNRIQVIIDLAALMSAKVRAGAGYIGFLLVADDSMPMFPGKSVSL